MAPRIVPHLIGFSRKVQVVGDAELSPDEAQKRQETLSRVVLRTSDVLLVLIGGLTILAEMDISIGPVLAGAGVAGVALGFGAQTLVKDLLSGLFILLENQYSRGDVVQAAGVSGVVEDVNLRRTVLRDRVASNFTRGWSRVNLNISVSYEADLDHVRDVLNGVGAELAADPTWRDDILEAPKVLRLDAFESSGIALKVLATTKPLRQWDVAGELRLRIKRTFDAKGITIPYPHVVVLEAAQQGRDDSPRQNGQRQAPSSR
ncbi:MAG: mechanosensitive ion channel family protein [Chloroflexota bacterium]